MLVRYSAPGFYTHFDYNYSIKGGSGSEFYHVAQIKGGGRIAQGVHDLSSLKLEV